MKIAELFKDVITENRNYEFKAALNSKDTLSWAKTLVGFANGEGGILFIGVADDGEAFGLDLGTIDKLKTMIYEENTRHIFPHIKFRFLMRSVDPEANKFVLGVQVEPSPSMVRYQSEEYSFSEQGNSGTSASSEGNEISDIPYAEENWTEYNNLCHEYRMDKSAPTIKELESEEILSKDGFAKSGFLMFKDGYEGEETLLCCRLWNSKDKTGAVLDKRRMKGSLAKVFEEAMAFLERNTKNGWRKTPNGGRETLLSYPKEAVREALVNAIAHRDYSIYGTQIDVDIYVDRMEIVSPGSWLLPKQYEDYSVGSIPSIRRNPIIAACLDVANLMERGGTGFATIMDSYKDSPSEKQPAVILLPGFLKVCLYDLLYQEGDKEAFSVPDTKEAKAVLDILEKEGPSSVSSLQTKAKVTNRNTFLEKYINPLLTSGAILRDGSKYSPKALFRINPKFKK